MTAELRTRARAVLGAVSLLILGAVLGIAVDRHLAAGDDHSLVASFHQAAMSSLEARLRLEPAQRKAIDSIVAAHHDELQQNWRTLHAQLGATVDVVHRDIEAVLTEEQRAAFREWLREADAGD